MGELIFGIILLVAAFFVRLAASFIKTDSGRPVGGIVKIASLGLAVVGVLVVLGATAVVMNPGEVGVQHAFGTVTAQPLLAGIHIVPPWASVERYSSREEQWPEAGAQVEEIEALCRVVAKRDRLSSSPFSATAQGSWSTAKPLQLGELMGATPDQTANAHDATAWSNLIKRARDKRLLSPLLHTRTSSSTEPRIIGYILILPSKEPMKLEGEIFLATNESESARIPLAVEIVGNEPFLTKLYAAIPTTLVGLVATFGGAIIGYKFFLYQQNHLRRVEEEKRFADKKVELSKTIRALFKNDYSGLRNNQDSELERARQIRGALIDGDIYAILLWEEIQKVNNICDPNYEVPGSRLEALDRVLQDNFKEFMV